MAAVVLAFGGWLIGLAGAREYLVCGLGHPVYAIDEVFEATAVACAVLAVSSLLLSRR